MQSVFSHYATFSLGVNYFMSVLPFLAAVQTGVVGKGEIQLHIQVPAEAAQDYCSSFTDCSSKYPDAMTKWETFFQVSFFKLLSIDVTSSSPKISDHINDKSIYVWHKMKKTSLSNRLSRSLMWCQKICNTDHVYYFVQEVFQTSSSTYYQWSKGTFAHHCFFLCSSVVFAADQ